MLVIVYIVFDDFLFFISWSNRNHNNLTNGNIYTKWNNKSLPWKKWNTRDSPWKMKQLELFHEKWNTSDSQEKKSEMELTIPNQKSEIGIPGLQKGKILYPQN